MSKEVTLTMLLNDMRTEKIKNAVLKYKGYRRNERCHLYRIVQGDIRIKVFYYPELGMFKIKSTAGVIKNTAAIERAIIS